MKPDMAAYVLMHRKLDVLKADEKTLRWRRVFAAAGFLLLALSIVAVSIQVTAGVLAGCAFEAPNASPKATHSTSSAAPSVSHSPAVVENDFDGDGKVGPWDLEQLVKRTYVMPDGTKVPIRTGKPLPEVVVTAVQQAIAPTTSAFKVSNGAAAIAAEPAFWAAMEAQEAKISRRIVPVNRIHVDSGNRGWAVGEPAPIVSGGFFTKEQALAHATKWVNGNNAYLIVVFE